MRYPIFVAITTFLLLGCSYNANGQGGKDRTLQPADRESTPNNFLQKDELPNYQESNKSPNRNELPNYQQPTEQQPFSGNTGNLGNAYQNPNQGWQFQPQTDFNAVGDNFSGVTGNATGFGNRVSNPGVSQPFMTYGNNANFAASMPNRFGKSIKFLTFGPFEKKRREQISEDAAVLEHLIAKSLPTYNRQSLGVLVSQGFRSSDALYISGKGLILIYNVNLPVSEGDSDDRESKAADTPTAWETARQEMQNRMVGGMGAASVNEARGSQFNAEGIKMLDDAVKLGLAQAGNFRGLESDESITIYVFGQPLVRGNGHKTVRAWSVNIADAGDDKTIANTHIKTTDYQEEMTRMGMAGSIGWPNQQ